MYRTVLLYLTGIAVVAAASLAHGQWSGRWRNTDAVARAAASLGRVPRTIGDWAGTDQNQDDTQFTRAGADGFLVRRYENRVTGAALTVLVVCGRPGPICVHTPDVCYGGAGYTAMDLANKETISVGRDASAEFKKQDFRKVGSATGELLTIHWAWRRRWRPLDRLGQPPLAVCRAPALFKMYVIHGTTTATDEAKVDPTHEFLVEFLPRLADAIAASAAP